MNLFDDIIKHYQDIALSNSEVLKLVDGKANVILYPDLYKYNTIDEILNPYGACILLFEAKPSYGHWCCLFKNRNNLIEFFNPYGGFPDDSLEYIPERFRKISNQDYPHLSWLLINSPYDLSYNEFKFQKHNEAIKTCGRWCALRLLCRNMDLYDFHKMIEYYTKLFNITGDEFVTLLTMYINK